MMQLRKLLIAGSAMAAAAAFALVPVAQASTPGSVPTHVRVGANTAGTYNFTGILTSGSSVTMNVFGSAAKGSCYAGTNLAGTATAGTIPAAPTRVLRLTAMNLTCHGLFPGQSAWLSVPANGCAYWRPAPGALVHDGLTDRGPKGNKFQEVLGTLTLPAGCVMTMTAGQCITTIGGAVTSNFDEWKNYPTTPVIQNLNLKGTGLTILTASIGCFGAVAVGSGLTMNSVNFNITSASGAIDYRVTP